MNAPTPSSQGNPKINRAAFFDVDGTLINCQTQKETAKYFQQHGLISLNQIFKVVFWSAAYKMGLLKDSVRIRQDLYRAFTILPKIEIDTLMANAYRKQMEPHLHGFMHSYVEKHRANGDFLIALSGTFVPICQQICKVFSIEEYYATALEVSGDHYTSRWNGNILEGQTKADFLKQLAEEKNISLADSYAYADNFSDLPFLEAVGHPVVVSGNHRLLKLARSRGWETINLSINTSLNKKG